MFQFFTQEPFTEETVTITGDDVNHIKNVLRMKAGEVIRVCDKDGNTVLAEVSEIDSDAVTAKILEHELPTNELPAKITLFQGIAKGDRMEMIIQKTVELGVYEIVPVAMKNCVAKFDAKKAAHKVARYQAIAESAAKQSKRSIIPGVRNVVTFKEAVEAAKDLDLILVPYEHASGMETAKEALSLLEKDQRIGIFIGPEGGFDETEISAALEAGGKVLSLGTRILRVETASICALSLLMYQLQIL